MFAVIRTGGKQYRVAPGDVVKVERLAGEPGDIVELPEVLALGDEAGTTLGTPRVEGASVAAEVLDQGRARKILVFKKKRRQNYRRKNGHRQHETVLRVTEILTEGRKPSARKAEPKPAPKKTGPEKTGAKAAPNKTAAKKTAAKKPAAKKSAAKKSAAKKTAGKTAPAKKPAAKKSAAKKTAAKSAKTEE